jgi:hypothetical protein
VITVSPSFSDVYTALRTLLLFVVPMGTEVVQGLGNRVPMPKQPFVAMTLTSQNRITTNILTYNDPGTGVGMKEIEYQTQLMMQLDFYGPLSGQWAAAVAALFRDEVGVTLLGSACAPLYADSAQMMPLINGEEEYEQRWMVGGYLQWNPILTTPQEFADSIDITLVNVDERFPP